MRSTSILKEEEYPRSLNTEVYQEMSQNGIIGAFSQIFSRTVIISETHWKILDKANRQLALRYEKLQKARASRDPHGIQRAEMDYFQALQYLYASVETAVYTRKGTEK